MKKKCGRLVTHQNNCSAACVYTIFGFSSNDSDKEKSSNQNMILHLTNLSKRWDSGDADLPQHSPDRN